ncbi:MAG: response regulator transcription factor [Chloroflexi bacterium]|uniref:Response regulator transcription factor n=1 Tax=Candidatus Chlorohelix allophototropha TaxID=3003348 RepID=A0A8T7M987_9CHLR|nr:response regulator transcription factor [Chloroflexota bacterium]WJW68445.1 response regulator transcription factor [Chloroflexota bacterium L227-S17]
MAETLRILLVDDHVLFREGLASLLSSQNDLQVLGQASNGQEALIKARELMPDVVFMDVDMPIMNGLDATRAISNEMPYIKIIMLTVSEEEEILFQAIKNGAQGYLLKNIRAAEIVEMLRGIGSGEAPISRLMAARLLREFSRQNQNNAATPQTQPEQTSATDAIEQLTLREKEVLKLVAERATNKEIAVILNISEYTVKNHLRNILAKLHLHNRAQAAQIILKAESKQR